MLKNRIDTKHRFAKRALCLVASAALAFMMVPAVAFADLADGQEAPAPASQQADEAAAAVDVDEPAQEAPAPETSATDEASDEAADLQGAALQDLTQAGTKKVASRIRMMATPMADDTITVTIHASTREGDLDADYAPIVCTSVPKGSTYKNAMSYISSTEGSNFINLNNTGKYSLYASWNIKHSFSTYASGGAVYNDRFVDGDVLNEDTDVYIPYSMVAPFEVSVTPPMDGESATQVTPQVTVPDGAKWFLSMDYLKWIQGASNPGTYTGDFVAGNDYYIYIIVNLDFGYYSRSDTTAIVNGGEFVTPWLYGSTRYGFFIKVTASSPTVITYDLNGGELDGQTGTVTVDSYVGAEITLPTPTREGYTFDYWEGSRYEAGDTYTVEQGGHTFTAQWIENEDEDEGEDEDEVTPADDGSDDAAGGGDAADNPAGGTSNGTAARTGATPKTGDELPIALLGMCALVAAAFVLRRKNA